MQGRGCFPYGKRWVKWTNFGDKSVTLGFR